MIQVSPELLAALVATENQPVDLYELYLDSGTLYYADQAIQWGGRTYLPYVQERSEIKRYDGGQFDNVTVTFSNVDMALAQAMLSEEIEGRTLIVRKIDRTVGGDSVVLFRGPMERPGRITDKTAEISAKQILGSIDFDAPARLFGPFCGWPFKGYECGYAGAETACDKSWSNCAALANTPRYGAFRFIPHSGTYQYAEVESKRAWYSLGLLKRKKTKWFSANFEAVDDTPYDVPIPIVYGRVQMAGITIQHEDQGGVTKALVGFCIGGIENIYFPRANNSYITDATLHQGDLGGNSGQEVDPRFPQSYQYSLLAYIGVTIPSDVRAVDPAPAVTAVIRGRKVAIFDAAGVFLGSFWSDNPVWCTRDFLTLPLAQGGMGVPDDMIDDVASAETAAYCDAVIADTTNDQKIYNPPDLPAALAYKRYRSTGVEGGDPELDGPYDDYEPGVDDDTSRAPVPVNVKRFTLNVAIAKQEKAIDILYKKLLPSFRGYLTFSKDGKVQIRCERPVKNSAVTEDAEAGGFQILCSNAGQWAVGDLVLVSPLTAGAEVLTIGEVGADRLTFTTQLAYAHAAGAELLYVAMAFDDSNTIGSLEYPLSDRVSSTNRITIKYVDAPAGFEARELRINDYEHQAKTHRVNDDDVDGSAIDSYFQAWRIGQWARAKARDLARFCSLRADIKASLLEVGDVIAVSGAEVGLQAVPFRVIELGLDANDEVAIVGQVYSTQVYDDTAPQATVTVPAIFPAPTPAEPGQAPDAPNVLEATAAAFYCDANGAETADGDFFGFKGTLRLNRTHANFSETREVHICVTDPAGPGARVQDVDTLYPSAFTADTINWRVGGKWQRPTSDQAFQKIEFLCTNSDSKVTANPFALTNIAVAGKAQPSTVLPEQPTAVTCEDQPSERYLDGVNLTHTWLYPAVTLPAGHHVAWIEWEWSDDGVNWGFVGQQNVGEGFRFEVLAPHNTENDWKVRATACNNAARGAPVESAAFTVTGIADVPTSGVDSIQDAAAAYSTSKDGMRFIPELAWKNSPHSSFFFTRVLVRQGKLTGGVFTPFPDPPAPYDKVGQWRECGQGRTTTPGVITGWGGGEGWPLPVAGGWSANYPDFQFALIPETRKTADEWDSANQTLINSAVATRAAQCWSFQRADGW